MPEGDTIHRTAARLRQALAGRVLLDVRLPRTPRPWLRAGASVTSVEARGKHLLVVTDDGLVLHTHLGMTGSWRVRSASSHPGPSRDRAVVAELVVDGARAVCRSSPVVEVLDRAAMRRHPTLRLLGPDLCDPQVDLAVVLHRLDRLAPPDAEIGDVLLDQRIASGIGNVYRSEVLFLHGLHPATLVGDVDGAGRHALYATAGRLLRDNVDGGPRTTTGSPAGGLWVYGRRGRPCRRCGTAILAEHRGRHHRIVHWCPACQAPATPAVTIPVP